LQLILEEETQAHKKTISVTTGGFLFCNPVPKKSGKNPDGGYCEEKLF
jgi:hypothetical protein